MRFNRNIILIACLWACSFTLHAQLSQIGQNIDGKAANSTSGHRISLSADGQTVAIGARNHDGTSSDIDSNFGHVHVYRYEASTMMWTQLGQDLYGEVYGDQFGHAVSMSADGTTLAIGAQYNDVRVYRYDESTMMWTQLGLDIDKDGGAFSVSMSASGTTVAIGATGAGGGGRVRIHSYDESAMTWTQLGQNLNAAEADDEFGHAVSLSPDSMVVAIGARHHDNNRGHVQVYSYDESTEMWTQLGQDIDGEEELDESGSFQLGISADGMTVAIGAPDYSEVAIEAGHVRVFRYASDTWTQVGEDIDGKREGDFFGRVVNMSADGTTLVASASGDNYVQIYRNVSDTWTKIGQDIRGSGFFGRGLSLSTDGTTLAIGDPSKNNDRGQVQVYNIADSISIAAVASAVSEGGAAMFTLTRNLTVGDLTVDVRVEQEGDYVTSPGTLVTFADGKSDTTLTIAITDNNMVEPDGSIKVTVISGAHYRPGEDSVAAVTVKDNDAPLVTIAGGDAVTEGADAIFTLTRAGVTTGTLEVTVRVEQEGNYLEGDAPTTVSFATDAPTAELTIDIEDDEMDEVDGSIKVTVIDDTPYQVGDDSVATVTVMDDDLPVITIAGGNAVTEGTEATFTLTRCGSNYGNADRECVGNARR